MRKHRILFLAANPSETSRLALGQESRAIQAELERSGHRDQFELVTRWAVQPFDLLRELQKLRPTVVHFSGHGEYHIAANHQDPAQHRDVVVNTSPTDGGECDGLYFQAQDGTAHVVSNAALRETFSAAGSSVKLIVLNACHSEVVAEALLSHVDCVVGMAGSIRDDAARSFAVGFYCSLGNGASVEEAYQVGRAAVVQQGFPDSDRPRVKVRAGIDPRSLILAVTPSPAADEQRPQQAPPRSTIRSTAGEPAFTGREAELDVIVDKLRDEPVVVLRGPPGLGKSRLALEYAHKRAEAYPGGMFFIPFEQPPPVEMARLLRDADRSGDRDEPIEDQCRRWLRGVGSSGRRLLIYDAIADEHTLRAWLPPASSDWHVIATSTSALWARTFRCVDVRPLQGDAEHLLVASILGDRATDRLARRIAAKASGVTVELCASAYAAYKRLYLGHTVEDVEAGLAKATTSSFQSAWTLLSPQEQLVLQVASTFMAARFSSSLVIDTLQRIGWSRREADSAIDEVLIRQLLGRDGENFKVHQLVAHFVRAEAPLPDPVRQSLFQGLLSTAREFSENAGDLDRRASMQAYSLRVEDWAALVSDDSESHMVGNAIAHLGRYAEALPWFERAVAAAEKGDAHGQVDATSLGTSLHQVGYCYSSRNRFAEALPWFKRAVAAAKKGDVHGRVDSASLGRSLHQVGYCFSHQGQFAHALRWYKRAVAAAEKGDVHGHVDSESLGESLHQVGYCFSRQDQFAEALPWLERAVAVKTVGDVHGRVDSTSLGDSLHQVGHCYASQGKFAEALSWLERAVAAKKKGDVHERLDSDSLGKSLHLTGDCYASQGKFAEALPWLERAVAAKEKGDLHGCIDAESLGRSLYQLGDCYARQGQSAQALPWFERATSVQAKDDRT